MPAGKLGEVFPLDHWDHLAPFWILSLQQFSECCYHTGGSGLGFMSPAWITGVFHWLPHYSQWNAHYLWPQLYAVSSSAPKPFPEPLLSSHSTLGVRLEFLIPGTTLSSKMPFKRALLTELWRLLCVAALCSSLFITLNLFVIYAL